LANKSQNLSNHSRCCFACTVKIDF